MVRIVFDFCNIFSHTATYARMVLYLNIKSRHCRPKYCLVFYFRDYLVYSCALCLNLLKGRVRKTTLQFHGVQFPLNFQVQNHYHLKERFQAAPMLLDGVL